MINKYGANVILKFADVTPTAIATATATPTPTPTATTAANRSTQNITTGSRTDRASDRKRQQANIGTLNSRRCQPAGSIGTCNIVGCKDEFKLFKCYNKKCRRVVHHTCGYSNNLGASDGMNFFCIETCREEHRINPK